MDKVFGERHDEVDTVEYSIHRDFRPSPAYPAPTQAEWQQAAEEFIAEVFSFVSQWTDGYIWHKDAFVLRTDSGFDASTSCIRGSTRFGDCLEDEWFIVSLLVEITAKYPDAVVSVRDNDGEFLLIEAADHLSAWIDPTTIRNRVFLHKGVLHIIPIPRTPAEIPLYPAGNITLEQALDTIRGSAPTNAPEKVQDVIMQRLNGYPGAAMKNMHHAKCHVPFNVAQVLHHEPNLIAPAVEAFYNRDPLALKACYKMEQFPPASSTTSLIRMNRHQYAQLVSQKFHPPKPFRLPPPNSPDFKSHELGMKIACGFEMLYADEHWQNLDTQADAATVDTYAFAADPAWARFLHKLNKLNFFRSELPGSRIYKDLESRAQFQFLQARTTEQKEDNPVTRIKAALARPPVNITDTNLNEDSDSWMDIDPTHLDDMLNARQEEFKHAQEDFAGMPRGEEDVEEMDEEDQRDMDELAKMFGGFSEFVGKQSGLKGALFPNEEEDEEEEDNEDEGDGGRGRTAADRAGGIKFDDQQFMQTLMQAFGIDATEMAHLQNQKSPQQQFDPDVLRPASTDDSRFTELADDDDDWTAPFSRTDNAEDSETDEPTGDPQLEQYMQAMDRELLHTKLAGTFEKAVPAPSQPNSKDDENDEEEGDEETRKNAPVDLDLNLVKNILESFSAQEGLPGPAGSMLGGLGIKMPRLGEGARKGGGGRRG
ncbi:SGT1 protein-domain-containing protein [Fimicolochytrium jonesii]|uniref:SGT1 protein-domain-containing protein n=1 Tax=Fimicolochytrium jonesii TaxID=1396493 RepID=UPI0022FE959A|nr:SGT1 protein-domain-containing protein [Fimicolochytrium jonesii]KAI8821665.1 SGT1 protein-domain-containing protein [Fimicolochytrium jonesii]